MKEVLKLVLIVALWSFVFSTLFMIEPIFGLAVGGILTYLIATKI